MANYHQIKNAAILTPTTNTDLGSDAKRYANVYMSGNIVMSNGITVTSTNVITPKVASLTLPGTETAVGTAGGETVTITGTGFSSGANVLIGSTVASSTTYISSTSISFTTPALSAGTYVLYVVNTDGGTATYIPGISFSGTPTWTTSAGSLGSVIRTSSVNISVAATGDATLTYAVKSGSSLPSGLSLDTSSGAITGTAPTVSNDTTYNFTLTVKDGQNQTTDRAFSLTVSVPVTITLLVVAGGGSGGASGCGGGAGGLLYGTMTASYGSPYTITIGAGGAAPSTGVSIGNKGSNTVFGSATAIGGGPGAAGVDGANSSPTLAQGGSGGGSGYHAGAGGNAQQTDSGGLTGFGNLGGEGHDYGAYAYGGGGGGAGAVGVGYVSGGTNTTGSKGWAGGIGKQYDITGTNLYYAGGGGATGYMNGGGGSSGGDGGLGGGAGAHPSGTSDTARGATVPGVAGGNGGPNTGGGGGGSGYSYGSGFGGGGSGVVIIRYADTASAASATTGSPTVTTPTGYRVYKFTTSGSITF